MIEFRILGPLDLRWPDGTELRPVLSQPKRLVLLAYLAATPGSFRRRDTLLGLFWPEFDQRRARAALRQSIYHLRRTLGSDVVIGRGDEELGVDPSRLWCDVAAFRQAVAEGRFRDAVELYRGELLDGIYIDGAPEVERWIEEERARLQAMAARAAWSLAEATVDDPVAAAGWARRAVEFMPDDEASVRRLIDFLASSGDRAGALRAYEEFARRLERDYETTPSAATQELIERVRAADPGPADDRAASGSAPRRGPRPRGGGARPAPARSPSTFAFLPFTFRGAPEYGYLAEGVPELLALAIDGAGTLRSVDPFALQGWLSREGADLPDPERIGAIGERFGAGYCVTGGIVEAGGRIRVHASLHATDSPEAPRARVAAEAGVDEVLAVVDRLATDLLVDGIEAPHGELARVAAKTTESLSALKAYLTGEHEYRAGRYSPAAESFHLAVEEDPGFAVAHYRLATLAEWAGYPSGAEAAATLAVQHADRLSVNDLRLLEALRAYFEGDVARAEHLYREILAIHPDSVEAWFQLAKLGYFLNTLRGRPIGEARDALDRAAELDPDNIIVLVHQALLAVKAGCPDDVDAFTRRALALLDRGDYADFPLLIRVIRTFGLPGQSGQSELWSELEAANPSTLFWCMAALTCAIGDVAAAERLSEVAIRPTQPAPVRLFGRLARAGLALGRGRWSGARDELAEAARLDPVTATVNHAFLALVHFRDPGPEELYALRDELSALTAPEPSADPVLEPWFSAHSELFDASRTYLLGLIHVRLGELEEAEARDVELDALAASAPGLARASHARDAARGIRAQIACRIGALDEALACLEACELAAPTHLYFSSVLYGRLHERCLRAELLARLGRDAEAQSWFAALEDSPHGAPYLAHSHLRRAELFERRGEADRARVHRARLAALWKGADPELQSLSRAVKDLPVLRPVPGERVAAQGHASEVRVPVPRERLGSRPW